MQYKIIFIFLLLCPIAAKATKVIVCDQIEGPNLKMGDFYSPDRFPQGNESIEVLHGANELRIAAEGLSNDMSNLFSPPAWALSSTMRFILDENNEKIWINGDEKSSVHASYSTTEITWHNTHSRSSHAIDRVSGRLVTTIYVPEWFIERWEFRYKKKYPETMKWAHQCRVEKTKF